MLAVPAQQRLNKRLTLANVNCQTVHDILNPRRRPTWWNLTQVCYYLCNYVTQAREVG